MLNLALHRRESTYTATKNPIYVFPEKELRDLSPNFDIHVVVSDLYIPKIGPRIFLQQNIGRLIVGNTNRSQTHEFWNWDWGWIIPLLGIFVSNFGTVSLQYTHFILHKCPSYNHDGASVKLNNTWDETNDYICISYSLNKDDIGKLQKKSGPEDFLESAAVVFQMEGGEFQSEGGKAVLQLN